MIKKSIPGRVFVGIFVTGLLCAGTIAVFGSLIPTIYLDKPPRPSDGEKHQRWCIETAIYLQDYMDNSFARHVSTTGALSGFIEEDVQTWNAEFQAKLEKAKEDCLKPKPDPGQPMHRLFLGLSEEHKAYVFWSTSKRLLRNNFVRDTQLALNETTLR